jgi:hypothetical protein
LVAVALTLVWVWATRVGAPAGHRAIPTHPAANQPSLEI